MNARMTAFGFAVVAICALAMSTAVAYAGWCWSDPIVGFRAPGMREAEVNIVVGVPEEHRDRLVNVEIVVIHPINVTARVKFSDGLLPEQVRFVPSPLPWLGGQVPVSVAVSGVGATPVTLLDLGLLGVVSVPVPFPLAFTVTHTRADGAEVTSRSEGLSIVPIVHSFRLHVSR